MSRFDHFHYSTAQCYEQCPCRYKLTYIEGFKTLESDDARNALKIGTALHRGIETDVQTAIHEYLMSYPIITDDHVTEAIKLEYWIPKVKQLLPEGLHEVPIMDDWFEGTMDLIVPCTKYDAELPHGKFDLYDFKYSNNIESYMQSKQLHVYKYFFEKITGKSIRNMYFVFVPKTSIKRKKYESIIEFRKRVFDELEQMQIQIKEVQYDPTEVLHFYDTYTQTVTDKQFEKHQSYLCNWCEFKEYCEKGESFNMLPKAERRVIGSTTKRKLWIYGSAFSGKTTFVDQAPNPLNLNTDGNIQFVTQQYVPIKDTYEGRQKVLAWQVFKNTIDELEKNHYVGGVSENGYDTIVVDLLEDTYESCRLYMYDKLGITHESDDSFRAWDKVRTEFLSTLRRLINLDYQNIILISHEDTSKDITKKSGDKITAIKPNIPDKVANKIAGMVDIVARVVVEDDETRTLNFKSNEVVFGGGRLKGIKETQIPLDWNQLVKVYGEADFFAKGAEQIQPKKEEKTEENVGIVEPEVVASPQQVSESSEQSTVEKPRTRRRRMRE